MLLYSHIIKGVCCRTYFSPLPSSHLGMVLEEVIGESVRSWLL